MATSKCTIINVDVTKTGSQVLMLAKQNEFLDQYIINDNGGTVDQALVSVMKSDVAESTAVVNQQYGAQYGAVDNITWADFTNCTSIIPSMDANGNVVLDSSGNPVYDRWNRTSLAMLGRDVVPKYVAAAPLHNNTVMQTMVAYVPLSCDKYAAPEMIVLVVLCVAIALLYRLMFGGDDEDDTDDEDGDNADQHDSGRRRRRADSFRDVRR